MKNTIMLTESQFKTLIAESVKSVLTELHRNTIRSARNKILDRGYERGMEAPYFDRKCDSVYFPKFTDKERRQLDTFEKSLKGWDDCNKKYIDDQFEYHKGKGWYNKLTKQYEN